MLTPKEYKKQTDKFSARYNEYLKKCNELESQFIDDNTEETDEEYNRLYDQLDEEYKDVCYGWNLINAETMVTKEFLEYFHPSFERRIFCLNLLPYYGKKLDDGSIFKGIVYRNNFYYYLVEDNKGIQYYAIGETEFEIKMEQLVLNTHKHRYVVKYNDGWDDDFHTIQVFDTEAEAKAFVAEKEKWKQEFKDEFGVDYDSLLEGDFTFEMEDWLAEFVNTNENKEEIRYFIDEV